MKDALATWEKMLGERLPERESTFSTLNPNYTSALGYLQRNCPKAIEDPVYLVNLFLPAFRGYSMNEILKALDTEEGIFAANHARLVELRNQDFFLSQPPGF